MSVTINGFRVVSLRVETPWRGVWHADVDVDPDIVSLVTTSGPAVIVIGSPPGATVTLLGTIDPLASGSFVATARLRVLGGGGGWAKTVPAQDFQSDAGVLSTLVYSSTGGAVEEVVADLIPSVLGQHYARAKGRASQVLDGVDWWVDPTTGITNVGPRTPAIPDTSLEILSWDPLRKAAEVACDVLVAPGTPLVDPRIGDGVVTVRDVEQIFDANGSRAMCLCSVNPVSRLQTALRTMVREFSGVGFLATRRYRVVSPGGQANTWLLQAVERDPTTGGAAPLPDLLPVTGWTGLAGATAKLLPSSEVLVGFVDGDPSQPVVLSYSTQALPLEATLDASVGVHVAPTSPLVDVGQGASSIAIGGPAGLFAARVGDPVQAGPFAGTITLGSLKTTIG